MKEVVKNIKLPISGGIESHILMPPETGNFFEHLSQLPVSGGIKWDILMPLKKGNSFEHLSQLPVSGGIKWDILTSPETGYFLITRSVHPFNMSSLRG